jgi:hypothetical protein
MPDDTLLETLLTLERAALDRWSRPREGEPRNLLPLLIAAAIACVSCAPSRYAVVTQHNDIMRTGAYLVEDTLTPAAVDPATGPGVVLRYWRPVDGNLLAQTLYAPRVRAGGHRRDIVYAFTGHNTAYAYDLNEERDPGTSRGLIWSRTLPTTPHATLTTAMGVVGTPVIDLKKRTLYLVYGISNGLVPYNGEGDVGYEAEFHLAALDIRSGSVKRDIVISGSVSSTVAPNIVTFFARRQIQRAGLLLTKSPVNRRRQVVYVAFASRWREETHNWHGWVMGYDAATFAARGVFCSTPDRRANSEGGGIWHGGGGIAADAAGNLYFNTGNGPGSGNDHGNSIVKLTPVRRSSGAYDFNVTAFSAAADDPTHAAEWANNDIDLGGGGLTVIPGSSQLASGGKTGVLYLMDRTAMTKVQSFDAFTNTYDPTGRYSGWMSGPHLHGTPTYWQVSANKGYVYHWGEKDRLKRFDHDRLSWQLVPASAAPGDVLAENGLMPGGLISLSANGTHDGLLWITLPAAGDTGKLFAFDALTMRRLWETAVPAALSHNNPPTIAQGRIIVGQQNNEFLVYGLARVSFRPPDYVLTRPEFPLPPDPGLRIQAYLRVLLPERATTIAAPQGHRALFLARAKGTLTYEMRQAPAGGAAEWMLVGMTGDLYDESGVMPNMGFSGLGQVIAHTGDGLTLTAHDRSRVSVSQVAIVNAPKDGDAAWALFRSNASETSGLLRAVTYVQRLATAGGAPPGAAQAGGRVEVPYEAVYAFYAADPKSK